MPCLVSPALETNGANRTDAAIDAAKDLRSVSPSPEASFNLVGRILGELVLAKASPTVHAAEAMKASRRTFILPFNVFAHLQEQL